MLSLRMARLLLGLARLLGQFFSEEKVRALHFLDRRDPSRHPVGYAIRSPFAQAEQASNLRRATKFENSGFVVHGEITHHV